MTCREFADFLMDYLSHELSTESRAAFDYHLSLCTNCQRYLASYRETIKLGKRAFEDPDADLPSQVPEELVKAILAARPKQKPTLQRPVRHRKGHSTPPGALVPFLF